MLRKKLEYALDWALEWLEDRENKERIVDLIAEVVRDVEEIRRDWKESEERARMEDLEERRRYWR